MKNSKRTAMNITFLKTTILMIINASILTLQTMQHNRPESISVEKSNCFDSDISISNLNNDILIIVDSLSYSPDRLNYNSTFAPQYQSTEYEFGISNQTSSDKPNPIPSHILGALRARYSKFLKIDPSAIEKSGYIITGETNDGEFESLCISKTQDSDTFAGIKYQVSDKPIELDENTAADYWHECNAYQEWLTQENKNSES